MFKRCQKQIIITITIMITTTSRHQMRSIQDENDTSSLNQRFRFEFEILIRSLVRSIDQKSRSSQKSDIRRLIQKDKQQNNLPQYLIAISRTTKLNLCLVCTRLAIFLPLIKCNCLRYSFSIVTFYLHIIWYMTKFVMSWS